MITLLNGDRWEEQALLTEMGADSFYYGYLGKHALSSSSIKLLEKSPKHYHFITKYGDESNSSALQIGNFIHTMILEPHLFEERFEIVDVQSRVAKAYKEAKSKSKKIVLTAKENDENMRIVDAALRNEELLSIIGGSEFEVPAIGMIDGFPFRGKADIYDPNYAFIADLKTTSDIRAFEYSADKYGYDIQAFIYCELFQVKPSNFKFVAIDKGSLDIGIFSVEDSFVNKGYKRVKAALELYEWFFKQGHDLDTYTIKGTLK